MDQLSKFKQCNLDSPLKFSRADWWAVIKRTWISSNRDNVSVIAAGVAFFSLIAVFPLISAAISLFSFFANPSDVDDITKGFRDLMPSQAFDIIQNQIVTVVDTPGEALGIGIIISLSIAIFSAGAGIRAMMRAMNIAYEEIEKRNFFFFFFYGSVMTLGSFVLIWLSLLVIVGIPAILNFLSLTEPAEYAARILPWFLLIFVFAFAVGVMYRFGPSRRAPRKRWVYPGIAFATLSWLLISYSFSKFVAEFGNYNATYGSLSAVVILLVWLWLTANIVIIGAELNSELERQTLCDTTRGPARALGKRGATMADFKAKETSLKEATAEIVSPKDSEDVI